MRKFSRLPGWLLFAAVVWFARIPGAHGAAFYQGVSPATVFWPGGTVPYLFDTNYPTTAAQQAVYLSVMREWELAGKIHLVPYTNQSNYLLLQYNPSVGSGFCLLGTPTVVSIATLERGYAHEMGHALGFDHEHQRLDRTNFITVNFSNIIGSGMTNNPEADAFIIKTNNVVFGAYDFESVMHYARNAFSTNVNVDTIDPLPVYMQKYFYRIGGLCLSAGDFAGAAFLYGAPTNTLTNIVTNTQDVGFGTLRAALYYANIHPGTTIHFNIPTSDSGYSNGVWTIKTTGELPPIVADGTIVDGSTQPGFAGHPVVVLDGSALLPDARTSSGLYVYQANCVIKYLAFDNFKDYGIALRTYSATNNIIQNCYIGVDATGTNATPNNFAGAAAILGAHTNVFGPSNVISGNFQYGILISDANSDGNTIKGNIIGLNAVGTAGISNWTAGVGVFPGISNTTIGGTNATSRNVISGNGNVGGIYVMGSNTTGTVIQGNYIGTAADGKSLVVNSQPGIYLQYGPRNTTIGGTNVGAGNLISGNQQDGIFYFQGGTNPGTIMGNFIGTDFTGTNAGGNGFSGINITSGTQNLVVGGTNIAARNVISGNLGDGIVVSDPGTAAITVVGNYVGVATNGTKGLGNGGVGIYVTQGPSNIVIGGTTAGTPNLISGNTNDGIAVYQGAPNSIIIQGNAIGTDKTGTVAIGNQNGVSMDGGTQGVLVGGTTVAARNLISGNHGQGVTISDATTSGNFVTGNYIGTATNGTSPLPNASTGVYLLFAPSNTVGGTAVGTSNIISGNSGNGIDLYGNTAIGNVIAGNYIGVDKTGVTALGNAGVGLTLSGGAQSNTIGGTAAGSINVISGNTSHGIAFYVAGTSGNLVAGNLIGVDKNGTNAIANGGCGVLFSGGPSGNTIGGTSAPARNVIGKSLQSGLYFFAASNNIIQGNFIGTDVKGNTALSNAQYGIYMVGASSGNLIGGATAGAGNVIAASGFNGVLLSDAGTTGNVFQGNSFGVGANGTAALGNSGQAFWIAGGASNNVIGLALNGSGAGNTIAYSQFEGIFEYNDSTNTVGNSFRGNLIYSNGKLGINLFGGIEDSFGTTANHSGGAVAGPNHLQNYPVLSTASVSGAQTTLGGTLNSTANRSFALDFYQDAVADASGHGQAQVYAGSTNVTTAGTGNASFGFVVNSGVAGLNYAVTATDLLTGDTSEFSLDKVSTNAPAPPSAPTIRGPFTYSATNGFGLNVAVTVSQNYHIQANTNLATTNWVNLTNFTAGATNFAFTDHTATNLLRRFYRVVSP